MGKMSFFRALTEGGQTWAHRIRMLRQVFKLATTFSFCVSILLLVIFMMSKPLFLYQALWFYIKSNTVGIFFDEIQVDPDFWAKISREYFATQEFYVNASKVSAFTEPYKTHFLADIAKDLDRIGLISAYAFGGLLLFFLIRGILGSRQKHVAGRKKLSAWLLNLKLKMTRKSSPFKIGQVHLIKGTETQHILVSGGTGSGKTNCFHHILPQIQKKRQKAIVIDTTGVFVERYYRENKDILLNPFDHRSVPWHPWAECADKFDFDAIAESFIPQSLAQQENYWRMAARSLFSAVLQKTGNMRKTSEVCRWLLYEPLSKLCEFVQGTKAGAHLDIGSEKTAASIRSVATTFLECLEHVDDTIQPFSIRQWIQNDRDDSWLFLNCKPAQRTTLNPLLSCWFSISARNLLQLQPDFKRRLWFIIDELPSLNRLKELENFVAESRKYGGCGLFAFQSPAQIEAIYGQAIAKTIVGNCMTKIVFAEQDPEIAEMISRSFGEKEVKEYQEGLSYGAHETRDGVNLSLQSKKIPLVTPSEIQSLERNQGYIKLPGNIPITKIKLSTK
jgi:type IV conjugative transfer system coupling protein TraD